MESPLHFHHRFLPFEKAILTAIHHALPKVSAELMARQIACVNKIQRLLDWQEVEFYCMRWFRVVWPEEIMFRNRGEVEFARAMLGPAPESIVVSAFCVAGHIFSLESQQPMRPLRALAAVRVSDVEMLQDPMAV